MININNFDNLQPPTYIPVTSKATFDYDVVSYYNEYYASPYITQYRRILRNYINNVNATKEFNQNPFINKNKKYNFLYTNGQTYMFIENNNSNIINKYILINNCWRLQKILHKK